LRVTSLSTPTVSGRSVPWSFTQNFRQENCNEQTANPRVLGIATIVVAVFVVAAAPAPTQAKLPVQRAVFGPSSLPTELQSGLSAVLGQDASAYHTQALGDSFDAPNPRQKLNIHFNSESDCARG
jgi:hypothetical protein